MIIGCIGLGMVGKTIYHVFSEQYKTIGYDVKIPGSTINDILSADIVFIAVPTKVKDDCSCDLSILDKIMEELHKLNYKGIICIKSTLTPETTINYIHQYSNENICFCPEFLKERSAYNDFKYNNKICIVGTLSNNVFESVKEIHSNICSEFRQVHPTEAELTKYFQNVYNTNRILFANAFYEICKSKDIEYDNIIDNLLVRGEIDDKYLRCNEKMRGPSGPCLVKDTLAFNEYTKSILLDSEKKINIFQALVDDIKLYPKTVIGETRTELEYFGKNL
jgi:UDPglucose 6-dehydrogenase